ncbi:ABC transporter permease subunit [Candidatus Poribacteria bacterium]|nr:ABC transporter permease subunit [Candidatus Poribacteria bacterium]MYH80430.1 ABC transporter permease subunit [Candidatus Poribacteria bacterium]MYK96709.1 ABC transporter permease subunit [Candidatus Poribacteria bacterium]
MLREIIWRELLDHLQSLRFALTLLLVIVLMLTGSVLYIHDYRQQVADYRENVNETLQLLENKAKRGLHAVVSGNTLMIYRAPSPLGFIAEGHEKDLPNAFGVSGFDLDGPQTVLRKNYTLQRFDALDWVFTAGVILSFAAFAMTYDSISGEAETGTLRLCLSNPLPRVTLIFGKYIGVMISLSIPLIIGICMNVLILSLFGVLSFELTYWLQIGGVVLFSVLYISVFATLGMFISCLTRTSSVSLVLLLLVWVCFVVFIPRTGGLLASRLTELPDEKTIARQANDATHEILNRYGRDRFSRYWSTGEPLTRAAKIGDAKQAIYNGYRNQQLHQVKLAQDISRISPTAIYQIGCEALVSTGIKHYERFFKKAIEYRRNLLQFTYEEYPFNPNIFLTDTERQQLRETQISLDKIPKFDDTPSDFSTAFTEASLDILLLFLFNLVFSMGAFLAFTRYDV